MTVAPILLFTYKRLDTLKMTVEALKLNTLAIESELFIFSDAAKTVKDKFVVEEVRKYIHSVKGFKRVEIVESLENKGLATSIITGVNYVFEKFDSVIVLEDDLGTTPNFLSYMNLCLHTYGIENKVFSISGYSFDLGQSSYNDDDAYFLSRGWSWGWATWKNRWVEVDWKVKDYDRFKRDFFAKRSFSRGGSDLNKMLHEQMTGKLDSWAIRWFYHQFKIGGLTVYPVNSKVFNNGFDEFATHTNGSNKRYLPNMDTENKSSFKLPQTIDIDLFYQKRFANKMGVISRLISRIETTFLKILK